MSVQSDDPLIIKGKTFNMSTLPMEAFWLNYFKPKPAFAQNDSSNWKGYYPEWEIRDNSLYLISISGTFYTEKESAECNINTFFPDATTDGVMAGWYTGYLRIPQGRELIIENDDTLATVFVNPQRSYWKHERYLMIKISEGNIIEEKIVENNVAKRGRGWDYEDDLDAPREDSQLNEYLSKRESFFYRVSCSVKLLVSSYLFVDKNFIRLRDLNHAPAEPTYDYIATPKVSFQYYYIWFKISYTKEVFPVRGRYYRNKPFTNCELSIILQNYINVPSHKNKFSEFLKKPITKIQKLYVEDNDVFKVSINKNLPWLEFNTEFWLTKNI